MIEEIKEIELSKIDQVDRKRKDLGEKAKEGESLDALARSIDQHGLLQPIGVIVKKDGSEGTPNERYVLAFGGRRIAAHQLLQRPKIKARIFPELNKHTWEIFEHEENIVRKNLDWKERAIQIKRFSDIQREIYGDAPTGVSEGTWSNTKTADVFGLTRQHVGNQIKVAKALETAPMLFDGCKSMADAKKVLRRIHSQFQANQQIAKAEKEGIDVRKQKLIDSYIPGDFLSASLELTEGTFDLAELDPPYNIDLDWSGYAITAEQKAALLDRKLVSLSSYHEFMFQVLQRTFSLLKDNSWLILWHPTHFEDDGICAGQAFYTMLKQIGFNVAKIPGFWVKPGTGSTMNGDIRLGSCVEPFIYASKGTPKLNEFGQGNVFIYPTTPPSDSRHPTERPINLMEAILRRFGKPGNKVLVPFLGSGVTLLAASNLYMEGVGFDIATDKYTDEPTYKGFFVERVVKGEVHKYI